VNEHLGHDHRDGGVLDPERFEIDAATPRGFHQEYVHEGIGGVPLVCVHGWPETKRIWWRVVEPLAAAGFEVIAPDLRGFGDSDLGPDGFHDVPAHAADLYALVHDHLGHDRVVLAGGDLGGPVIQELSLRHPEWVDRMVLFNSPLPHLKGRMDDLETRPPDAVLDYFVRQGTDPDGLAAELDSAAARRAYIAEFYGERHWAHPGAFTDEEVAFMVEPFTRATHLRASFGAYEATFSPAARSDESVFRGRRNPTRTLVLFGTSDHVIHPDFDRMAERVFPDHVGPLRLEHCGHFVPWEAPEVFVRETVAFCADLLA